MLMDPLNSVRVTSFSNKRVSFDRRHIVLFQLNSIIIFLFDDSNSSWCHVKRSNFVFSTSFPHNSSVVTHHWFTFKEDACSTTKERSIHDEGVTNNPSDIRTSKVAAIGVKIKYMFHTPVKSNSCTSLISNNSLRSSSCSTGV
jgi:hypothetical protein